VTVVSIAGGSGAGKSQLAKALAELLGEKVATRVPTDWYLVPRATGTPVAEWLRQPLAWDHAAIARLLAAPVGETHLTPPFDFTTFRHADRTGERKVIPIRPVMVLDAMDPWPGADLSVLLAVPEAVRHRRVAERDIRWGSRVLERWEQMETTWRRIEERGHRFDVTLDGALPIAGNAARIAAALHARQLIAGP
jgi:uridine kinase